MGSPARIHPHKGPRRLGVERSLGGIRTRTRSPGRCLEQSLCGGVRVPFCLLAPPPARCWLCVVAGRSWCWLILASRAAAAVGRGLHRAVLHCSLEILGSTWCGRAGEPVALPLGSSELLQPNREK